MRHTLLLVSLLATLVPYIAFAQEASSGIDVRATVTAQTISSNELTEEPRSGSPITAGYRSVVYPTIKLDDHLVITAALQSISRPYYYGTLSNPGYGITDNILHASINYSRTSENSSLLLRAGVLPTAFGSFPLRYDDANNPFADAPLQYGYYDAPVTTLGLPGAQIDVTHSKWDGRVQLTNSSPANPRSAFAADQYPNWTIGAGYTIRQGFRIGVSAYRGPFLSRDSDYFLPGESNPNKLSARSAGVDVQWTQGYWNLIGEWQTFVFPYHALPTSREQAGYVEVKRTLSPRWYVAARGGYTHSSPDSNVQNLEFTGGLRTNRFQTIKFTYGFYREVEDSISFDHMAAVQLVTSMHLFSHANR